MVSYSSSTLNPHSSYNSHRRLDQSVRNLNDSLGRVSSVRSEAMRNHTQSSIDPSGCINASECLEGLYCSPTDTTARKIARLVIHTGTGALAGTAVVPGLGTAIGAGIGFITAVVTIIKNDW